MGRERRMAQQARSRAVELDSEQEERFLRKAAQRSSPQRSSPARYKVPTPQEMEAKRRREREEWERQRAHVEADVYNQPDDSRYQPARHDSLRTGQARATGVTSRVVGRQHTITRWQHDEIEAGRSGR